MVDSSFPLSFIRRDFTVKRTLNEIFKIVLMASKWSLIKQSLERLHDKIAKFICEDNKCCSFCILMSINIKCDELVLWLKIRSMLHAVCVNRKI